MSLICSDYILTSIGHKDLNSHILQEIQARKDGSYFIEVPFSVNMFNIGQHLNKKKSLQ